MDTGPPSHDGPLRVTIVTATYNRLGLFLDLVNDMKRTEWPDNWLVNWHVTDDASHTTTYYGIQKAVNETIPYLTGTVSVHRNARTLGCDQNIVAALYRSLEDQDYVLTLDSDMSLHPAWFLRLTEAIDWAHTTSDPPTHLEAVSAFNSRMHGTVGPLREGLVQKGSLGGPATIWKTPLLKEADLLRHITPRWGVDVQGWDWKLVDCIKQAGHTMAALSPSYAQHMGRIGAHSPPGYQGPFDQAEDFIGK